MIYHVHIKQCGPCKMKPIVIVNRFICNQVTGSVPKRKSSVVFMQRSKLCGSRLNVFSYFRICYDFSFWSTAIKNNTKS